MKLTIFYDSQCPLCAAEMRQLMTYNTDGRLQFEDLHAIDFVQRFPYIDKIKAMRILHGELDSGLILKGLDVTCSAWSIVGKHKWLAVLRWPLISLLADGVYRLFARYRHQISYLLTSRARCTTGCGVEK